MAGTFSPAHTKRARHARGTCPRTHRTPMVDKTAQQTEPALRYAVRLSVCLSVCKIMARPRPLSRPQYGCMVMAEPPPLLCVVRFVSLYHRPLPEATVFRQFLRRACAVSGQRRAEKNFSWVAIFLSRWIVIIDSVDAKLFFIPEGGPQWTPISFSSDK